MNALASKFSEMANEVAEVMDEQMRRFIEKVSGICGKAQTEFRFSHLACLTTDQFLRLICPKIQKNRRVKVRYKLHFYLPIFTFYFIKPSLDYFRLSAEESVS
ncbi:MAG: hypothetical protein LC778_03495 [Acidobacteria bacterium]|nr:hypothetical protein [Acidobacteriota bacterium]